MARILLVHDDEDYLRMFTQYLLGRGYDVTLARDYASAMACVQNESIHLVLFDPLWNSAILGVDLANALHSFDPTLPMLVLDYQHERYDRLIPGINISFVARPFDIEEVMLRIHRRLNP